MWNSKMKREKELVNYVEQEAKISLAFGIDCSDHIQRQSNSLLSVLLSGAGGALGIAVALSGSNLENWLIAGIAVTSAYLFILSALLVLKCMMTNEIKPPANDPDNLYLESYTAHQIRRFNLKNFQAAIEFNRERNAVTSKWLNKVRVLATATPLVFCFTWIYFFLIS